MKRTIILLLAAILALSVVGCKDKDSESPEEVSLKDASVGDVIRFGTYEQDNDMADGKENIEWIVLAKDANKILVISKYALDCQPYHTEQIGITWETCSLRKWLNETFLNTAFSTEEQSRIVTTTVIADKNPASDVSPGNDTKDKVFLLSTIEASEYFESDEERNCVPTNYAIAQGAYTNKSACWWWLRSPSNEPDLAAEVSSEGFIIYYGGDLVNFVGVAIRPVMWIDVGS